MLALLLLVRALLLIELELFDNPKLRLKVFSCLRRKSAINRSSSLFKLNPEYEFPPAVVLLPPKIDWIVAILFGLFEELFRLEFLLLPPEFLFPLFGYDDAEETD